MDPLSMMMVAGVASGAAGVGMNILAAKEAKKAAGASADATEYGALAQADAMRAQAASDQAIAAQNQKNAEAKALEERASAQRTATEDLRTARLTASRLGAVAGASGSSASDPTVMQLFSGIEKEGQKNAAYATAAGNQRANSINYQAALDRWTADTNAGIKRQSANDTIIGGSLSGKAQRLGGKAAEMQSYSSALSGTSSMALKYGTPSTSGSSTGYGTR